MVYPMINGTGVMGLFRYANEVSSNFFSFGIIFSLFLVLILVLVNKDAKISHSWAVASLTTSIFTVFLFIVEVASSYALGFSFVLVGIGFVWVFIDKNA